MEQFKEKLKTQNTITYACCTILFVFTVIIFLAEAGIIPFFTPIAGDTHWHSRWRGFIAGATTGILALMLWGLVRSTAALKNQEKLKKLYIETNDERQIQIWTSARAQAMRTFTMAGLVASIIAGYFSITVSLTIIASVVALSLTGLAFKIYYSRKF